MSDKRRKAEAKVEQTGKGVTVAITGVSGYIAGVLAKKLLERGYTVRGTVRDLSNKEKTSHLENDFPGLELFEADLLKEGSFEDCFRGCTYIFHTASPFQPGVPNPQEALVEPALKGTINVMSTALKEPAVKRIVLTSSCAAVRGTQDQRDDYTYTENDWNETDTVESNGYCYSKSVAERKAWAMMDEAKDSGKSLVTICPSFVLGPSTSARTDSTSVRVIAGLMDGSRDKVQAMVRPMVDVDDVTLAHIRAAENAEASGRYIMSHTELISLSTVARVLRENFPSYPIPEAEEEGGSSPNIRFSHEKAEKELGIEFTPIEDSVKRMGAALIEFGIVAKRIADK